MAIDTNIEKQIDELLQKMTLEEKVGQMNQYNGFWDVTGPVPEDGLAEQKYEHLKKGWVGSMLNVTGVEKVRKIQKLVVEESRLGIPLIFGNDVIHGFKTLAPIPLAEAASWDLNYIEQSARMAAVEGSAVGLNWTFAPMIDISYDARWGRVMEGGGEDPYLGGHIAKARVQGLQGKDLSKPDTIGACAKHFAGYGFAEAGLDYNTTDVSANTLYNRILPPFKAAVDADVLTVMNGFNLLNGVPVTGDRELQRDILKGKWGYDGFVVSDWGSIGELVAHNYAKDLAHAAELAANAGSDMDMESTAYIAHLVQAVKDGLVEETHIDDAVRRILRAKFRLGLFEDPYKYCNEEREQEFLNHKDHHSVALEMAKRSIVLLKNEKELLPLASDKEVLVIGELAKDKNSPLGSWRLGSDDHTAVSVLEGLDKEGIKYQYVAGPKVFNADANFQEEVIVNETDTSGIKEAVAAAKNAKVVLMVLGEHGFQSGEGRSRTKIDIPGVQKELLRAVHAVNSNIILVLFNGRPLTLSWEAQHIPAIVEAWQLGSQSGTAVAQILTGAYNPSGKLPMTFPRSLGQIPIYYNHYSTGRPKYLPNVFWTHYSDEETTPLYPFGFGLSYTSFRYSNLKIDTSIATQIKVSVVVENTGKVAGEEVVQLYIRDLVASVARPVKELKGFRKVELKAGETSTIAFTLTNAELGFFNKKHEWVVEPGDFEVFVGTSSQEGLEGNFSL